MPGIINLNYVGVDASSLSKEEKYILIVQANASDYLGDVARINGGRLWEKPSENEII